MAASIPASAITEEFLPPSDQILMPPLSPLPSKAMAISSRPDRPDQVLRYLAIAAPERWILLLAPAGPQLLHWVAIRRRFHRWRFRATEKSSRQVPSSALITLDSTLKPLLPATWVNDWNPSAGRIGPR